jgi:hypothetical protein
MTIRFQNLKKWPSYALMSENSRVMQVILGAKPYRKESPISEIKNFISQVFRLLRVSKIIICKNSQL